MEMMATVEAWHGVSVVTTTMEAQHGASVVTAAAAEWRGPWWWHIGGGGHADRPVVVGGSRTVWMTWTMLLLAAMSAPVTLVSFMVIASKSDTANSTVAPLRVSTGPETISELESAAL